MTNLSLYLTESADMYPSAAALGCEGVTTTYSELADQATRFAAYVYEHDVRPGDRVAALVPNVAAMLELHYAVPAAGGVLVPLNTRLTPADYLETYARNHGHRLAVPRHRTIQRETCPACGALANRERDGTLLPHQRPAQDWPARFVPCTGRPARRR